MPNSDPNPPQTPEPKRPSNRRDDSKRHDRQPSNNIFWYLMIGIVVVVIALSFVTGRQKGEELKFSQFRQGVAQGKYTEKNVHELTVGSGYITFQDQPAPRRGDDRDADDPVQGYYIAINNISSETQAELLALLDQKGIGYEFTEPQPEWQSLLYLLIVPVLFVVLLVWMFRRIGGAGSAMSFGRSRGRLYAQEDVGITFNDVAGIDEAVEELREVVEFLRTPGKYQALGGRIPRGVLLVGPPGTGKTLLAKAVAGEAGVPFFGLSGSDFVEMFVGVGAARVRDMFQQAIQRSPAIIFIDELDALGKTRGSGMPGGHDEREQTLNALLVEMDGFGSDQSVIVMAATNRPETLDPALLRPGRFDRNVLVDRPDVKGREAILKVHATKIKMDDTVDLHRLARITPGFVGADLANLVNEAALLAARNNKTKVTMVEFEDAVERVVAGLEKQGRVIHEDEKLRVAYHECGHALVACSLPHTDPVHKISIIPRGMGLGYTLHFPEDERQLNTQTELQNRIACLLGGIAAEEVAFSETSTGAHNDLQRATALARRMVTEFGMSTKLGRMHYSESARSQFLGGGGGPSDTVHAEQTIRDIDLETKRIIDEASKSAYEVLDSRRELLHHLARELMEIEVMDAQHLKRIIDEHKSGPQISPGTRVGPRVAQDLPDVPPAEDELPQRETGEGA